ncbi:ImmA/IrrE family metallo-endopeptidase [Paenibacillus koleovorans]|uniref:ImmA/IrrE family metallo-endopeptidase n=1 Tax=Paenibacillus koleovorans TaxID=121608 RepID=UPI000FD74523|nr:protease inhibitor I42 family protein [Paenibacillus koleovorans]
MMQWTEVVKQAAFKATEVHTRLGSKWDEAKSIDIFSIIEKENIVLMVQPLGNLAGAFIPSQEKGVPPGILINGNLPLAKQRYSAAHEYCHYLSGDEMSTDTESELFDMGAYKRSDSERIAEVFAARFLMPRPLVLSIMSKLGVTKNKLSPESVYSLSLRLGVSYQAMTNQLCSFEMITRQKRDALLRIKPKQIKGLLGAEGLEDSWNDVWVLNQSNNGEWIQPRPGDSIIIEMHENPSSGFVWKCKENVHINCVSKNWISTDGSIGSVGIRRFIFQASQEGFTNLEMYYSRPWVEKEFLEVAIFKLLIQGKRLGVSEKWLTGEAV